MFDLACGPPYWGRFETKWLAAGKNLSALLDLSGKWIDRVGFERQPDARRTGDERLERPLNTIRAHVRGVLEKTGGNRQVEIVALLTAISATRLTHPA
jgi:hypothetical protein